MSKLRKPKSPQPKSKKRNESRKNLASNYVDQINNLKKIKSLDGFKLALVSRLQTPSFQVNFFSPPEMFKEKFV